MYWTWVLMLWLHLCVCLWKLKIMSNHFTEKAKETRRTQSRKEAQQQKGKWKFGKLVYIYYVSYNLILSIPNIPNTVIFYWMATYLHAVSPVKFSQSFSLFAHIDTRYCCGDISKFLIDVIYCRLWPKRYSSTKSIALNTLNLFNYLARMLMITHSKVMLATKYAYVASHKWDSCFDNWIN